MTTMEDHRTKSPKGKAARPAVTEPAPAAPVVAGEAAARAAVVAAAQAMSKLGLSPGRSGNVSARFADGMLITPSGMDYAELEPSDIAFVAADSRPVENKRKPSSEWHFHLAAYAARPDRNAIVHTHSLNATALACARKPIPPFHYMVAAAGGTDIPLVPYATFGTEELARHVADGLAHRDACLLAHHGVVALGDTLSAALELAETVEILADQYMKVLTLGPVHLIDDDEMRRVLSKFAGYGQRAQSSAK